MSAAEAKEAQDAVGKETKHVWGYEAADGKTRRVCHDGAAKTLYWILSESKNSAFAMLSCILATSSKSFSSCRHN